MQRSAIAPRKQFRGGDMKNLNIRLISITAALAVVTAMSVGAAAFTTTYARVSNHVVVSQPATIAAVTDAQIAAIVVAANTVDIKTGELAQSKTKNPKVKEFADTMVRDHTAVNKAAVDLVTKLGVTPEENDTSRSLTSSGDQTREQLRGLSGKEFDTAYIDNEVTYHELVIRAIDDTLIPNAQNAELKALLIKVRPSFVTHLQHAEQLKASMAKEKSRKK
jgi:putative membrane protein